jgi:hypothetical protein
MQHRYHEASRLSRRPSVHLAPELEGPDCRALVCFACIILRRLTQVIQESAMAFFDRTEELKFLAG